MTTLKEFIEDLVAVDIQTHPLAFDTFIAGNDEKLRTIISLIQNAVTDLYVIKMPMLTEEVHIDLVTGQQGYPLPNNLSRVIEARNAKGKKLPLNDPTRKDSIRTPIAGKIFVSDCVTGDSITLMCQGQPPRVTLAGLCEPLPFPDWLMTAVRQYVVGQAYLSIRTEEGNQAAQLGQAMYQLAVQDLQRSGMHSVEGLPSDDMFYRRGWV